MVSRAAVRNVKNVGYQVALLNATFAQLGAETASVSYDSRTYEYLGKSVTTYSVDTSHSQAAKVSSNGVSPWRLSLAGYDVAPGAMT